MNKLIIKNQDYQKILAYCLQEKPLEACGIMAGIKKNNSGLVKKIYFTKNIAASSQNYLMNYEEQFAVFKNMRHNQWELISIFHSHPKTPARPSVEDIKKAYYPEALYTIISLQKQKPSFKTFIIKNNVYQEVTVIEKNN